MGSKGGVQLGRLLCQPVSKPYMYTTKILMLTLYRFVDRDMFMRYRGGGVGHKYMREIETKHEDMSRTRLHGKQVRREPDVPQTSGDEVEDTAQTSTPASDNGGSKSDESDDEDVDLSEGSSCSDKSIGSDEIASDDDGYDSYGLADP